MLVKVRALRNIQFDGVRKAGEEFQPPGDHPQMAEAVRRGALEVVNPKPMETGVRQETPNPAGVFQGKARKESK